jgi:squalene-hopene/tetraprenyl-beta-curcumene cyclase
MKPPFFVMPSRLRSHRTGLFQFLILHGLASGVCAALLLTAGCPTRGDAVESGAIAREAQANHSLRLEVERAIGLGSTWLRQQQDPLGSFSDARNPAFTALALIALQRSSVEQTPANLAGIQRGYAFLRAQAKPDGGIYSEGLSNYNTALSLLALLQKNDPADASLIEGTKNFLVHQQASNMVRPELDGGVGYGPTGVSPKRSHPDLDNTLVSLEALRAFEVAQKARDPEKHFSAQLDWKAAAAFVSRCQNLASSNPQPWVANSSAERGGFVYYPGFSNAGEVQEESGRKALRSSGSMSYAGLLSFIYAEIPKEDPRIEAAQVWLKENFTLRENPGLGKQGLFYYYHLMAKALVASGVEALETAGKTHYWARELGVELVNRQEAGGFWVNDTGRWMEKNQVLVTSYCLLTLDLLRSRL